MTLRCVAVRNDGDRCESVIVLDSGYCFAHDPGREEERRRARSSGGSATSNVSKLQKYLELSSLDGVLDFIFATMIEVRNGTVTPAQGQAIASLSRAGATIYEVCVLERRVSDLEMGRAS